jgi:hypothetical protein
MKRAKLAIGLVILAIAWIALREWLWRFENPVLEASASSPSGSLVAEVYLLNEGGGQSYGRGPAPYGVGVYVRHSHMPLKSFGSTLVFASYCGPEIHLAWRSSEELLIECAGEESPNLLLPSHNGVRVTYRPRARQKSS